MAASTSATPLPPTAVFLDSASDDEESFVVLGTSLPPMPSDGDSYIAKVIVDNQLIDGSVVEEAITLVQNHLSNLSESTSSFPSMPKVSEQDLIPLVEKVHLSTITTNPSIDLSPDEIQQKVDLLVEENIKLKETLHQNNLAMKSQYETLVLWQEDVMKVHKSHKEKFTETKKYIENLKVENVRLVEALALEQSKTSKAKEIVTLEAAKFSNDLINTNLTQFELETAKKKISSLETEIKSLQAEKVDWEKHCEQQNSFISQTVNLQTELDKCKQNRAEEIDASVKQLQQSESLQKILLDEIKMLKTKSADHAKCIKQEMIDNVQEQLMAAQMHITKLELIKNQDKETINEYQAKIANIEAEMKESKDTMDALRAQLEIYKSDFETEHQLRHNLNADKENIAIDLQQLQRRNKQLLEEVERLRGGDFVHVDRLEQATSIAPSAPEDFPPKSSYNCPLCMSRFNSLSLVEEHIEYCINNTS